MSTARSPYALICRHLREGEGLEHFAAPACEHGPAEAWCLDCDVRVAEQQGWTDAVEKEADKALYCTECYKRALRKHRFVEYVQGSDDPCEWDISVAPDDQLTPGTMRGPRAPSNERMHQTRR